MTASAGGGGRSRVVISNGFNKFHLAVAAAEAHSRGRLGLLITGAYPTRLFRLTLARLPFGSRRRINRLLDRAERVPDSAVRPLVLPELLHETGWLVAKFAPARRLASVLLGASFVFYGHKGSREIERVGPECSVFHYRSGFGQSCVEAAKAAGMVTLCDHSIAHPTALSELVGSSVGDGVPVAPILEAVLSDIGKADYVLVNSDFVRRTFIDQDYPADRIRVIYWGVDDNFIEHIPDHPLPSHGMRRQLKMLFVGSFNRRKGAHVLLSSLEQLYEFPELGPWELDIAGPVETDIPKRTIGMLKNLPVRFLGPMGRREVAQRMAEADVFLFPSLAEGSARVVFEALACGCYVITTPNAGSIVKDGVHGALVPPGDARALTAAIRAAAARRQSVAAVGRHNAQLVRSEYRQRHYGEALDELYNEVTP